MSSSHDQGEVLITGATGFLGIEVLARLLENDSRDVIALVRAADDRAAKKRIDDMLDSALGTAAEETRDRVEAVAADVARPGLGLSSGRRRELAERTELIVHSAASVAFGLPLADARTANVGGTSEMLAFADAAMSHGGLSRYVHISTAYVSGNHHGVFSEQDLYIGQEFRNSYEQSKCEAELLVEAAAPRLPTTILRPSIVVGDRHTGWTAAFNVIYWPLSAFSKGLLRTVPAVSNSSVDVVSVDYVADAIQALAEHPDSVGGTYNLTAGPASGTLGELAEMASGYFGQPSPNLVPPADFDAEELDPRLQRVLVEAAVYFPYLSVRTRFDSTQARELLEPLGIHASPLRDYMHRLLDFATDSRWGRNPISRVRAYESALVRA